MSIVWEILLILLIVLVNGLFSLSETALVSSRRTKLQQQAEEGNRKAARALKIATEPSRFLSTVQVWISLSGIVMGAFGGATVAERLAGALAPVPLIGPYAAAIAATLVVIVTTYLSVVFGELIPKQLALTDPEKVASAVARPMGFLFRVVSPVARLLTASSGLVLRLFGVPLRPANPVSEEEIKVMIDQGIEHGMFEEAERDMIEGVFDLGEKRVNSLMTPRTDVVWLDADDGPAAAYAKIQESGHSRFPVCEGGLDKVLGFVHAKDILNCFIDRKDFDLRSRARPPLYVPENALVMKTLETFKKTRQHVALVVDEYGIVQGLITIYDILESVVGDLPSTDGLEEPMAVQRKDGSWLLDGLLPVDRFKEIFTLTELPEEGSYQTLSGLILLLLGRIPSPADAVDWEGLRLEVMDMDGTRIDKVLAVSKNQAADSHAEAPCEKKSAAAGTERPGRGA